MKIALIFAGIVVLTVGCGKAVNDQEEWKAEIVAAERAFNDMAKAEGLPAAFAHFAAPDGVIRRQNKIISGKQAIGEWYEKDVRPGETLTWQPTFVDVSASGDLAYTYGDYVFTSPDSLGNPRESKGVFHTVWKRQANGEWKFVWD